MKKQTIEAFKILNEAYGTPDWANDETKRKQMGDIWDESLGKYSEQSVRQACLKYIKYHHTNKFPPLTCIEAELCEEQFNQEENADKVYLANKRYNYILEHRMEGEIGCPPSKIAAQRAIWNIYGVSVDGYNPDFDKKEWQ